MTFLDKLDDLMKRNNLNKKRLSEKSGIPYSTIDSFYKQSYNNIKLSTFSKLCNYFGVTMDSMARDELEIEYYTPIKKNLHITKEEEIFLQYYRAADDMHKGLAECAIGADKVQVVPKKDLGAG